MKKRAGEAWKNKSNANHESRSESELSTTTLLSRLALTNADLADSVSRLAAGRQRRRNVLVRTNANRTIRRNSKTGKTLKTPSKKSTDDDGILPADLLYAYYSDIGICKPAVAGTKEPHNIDTNSETLLRSKLADFDESVRALRKTMQDFTRQTRSGQDNNNNNDDDDDDDDNDGDSSRQQHTVLESDNTLPTSTGHESRGSVVDSLAPPGRIHAALNDVNRKSEQLFSRLMYAMDVGARSL